MSFVHLRRVTFAAAFLAALWVARPAEAAGNGNGNASGQLGTVSKPAAAKPFNDVLKDVAQKAKIKKIDRALAGELKAGLSTHKVLITLKPGNRDAFRKTLQQR